MEAGGGVGGVELMGCRRGGGEEVSEGLALEMTASLPPCGGLACKHSCLSSLTETPTLRRGAWRAAVFVG